MRRPSRTLRTAALALLACAAAAGCTEAWHEEYYVEKLRVLAVRAEPPDLAPGQTASLDAVVVDPRAPERRNTLIWLACDPNPAQLDQSTCADYDTLSSLNGADGSADPTTLPEDLKVLGMTPPAGVTWPIRYAAPADLFSASAADDPRRTKGVLAIVLLLAIAEEPPQTWPPTQDEITALLDRVRTKQVDSVLTIKRLKVSETATPNHNPALAAVRFGDEGWASGGTQPVKLTPGTWTRLFALPSETSTETYQDLDADGTLVTKTEHLSASWFTTLGDLSAARTVAGVIDNPEELYVPFVLQNVPASRTGTLYAVLRDGRGGAAPYARDFFLCDPNLAAPTLASVEPASGPAGTAVKLKGQGLDALLDARAGAGWLSGAAWSDADQAYLGTVPADAPQGPLTIVPRGKGCAADPTGTFTVTAP